MLYTCIISKILKHLKHWKICWDTSISSHVSKCHGVPPPPVITEICDPNRSRARHHRRLKYLSCRKDFGFMYYVTMFLSQCRRFYLLYKKVGFSTNFKAPRIPERRKSAPLLGSIQGSIILLYGNIQPVKIFHRIFGKI